VVYGAPIWVGGRWVYPHHVHAAPVWHDRHGPPHFDPRRSPGREIRY
jgi:hypothetical protein